MYLRYTGDWDFINPIHLRNNHKPEPMKKNLVRKWDILSEKIGIKNIELSILRYSDITEKDVLEIDEILELISREIQKLMDEYSQL